MPESPIDGWWELCEIWPNGGWGYDKGHENYKSPDWMLSRFTKVREWGGNYLINVSPRPTGDMPDIYYQRMNELKDWMKVNSESVFSKK